MIKRERGREGGGEGGRVLKRFRSHIIQNTPVTKYDIHHVLLSNFQIRHLEIRLIIE